MMLPHEVFAHWYSKDRAAFNDIFMGGKIGEDPATVEGFWREVIRRRDPRIKNHEMANREDWLRRAIPISLHGDAVPVIRPGKAGSKSLDVFSFMGILGGGPALFVKTMIWCIFENCKATGEGNFDTMKVFWQIMVWSLSCMYSGVYPAADFRGHPFPPGSSNAAIAGQWLAGGHFAVLWSVKGDLEHYAKCYGMNHLASNSPCMFCPANRGDDPSMVFTNFNEGASWKAQTWDAAGFKRQATDLHPIFQLPYISVTTFEPDELHIVHLGTSLHVVGSTLWLLMYSVLDEGSPAANLAKVWELVQQYYKTQKTSWQVSSLTLSMFVDAKSLAKGYPCLKAKGNETKHLVPAILAAWSICT